MVRFVRMAVLALAVVALGESTVFAQAIAGVVRDASGGVMPGVTVEASSPALIEKTRTAVTDGEGQYKIISLTPGTYTVTFTLTGFNTIRREGIEITNDFTAGVNAELKIGSIEETITVSGQSPLIDTQSVTQKKALTSELIDALPTGRTWQNLSTLVAGVSVPLSNTDVGGSNNERYQTMTVHGSRPDQMPLVMNGMPYNNMNNTGGGYNTTLVINMGTVQEMTITTSGLSAEARTSGVLSNTLPKEGGNNFRGYFFGNYTNNSLQANNLTQSLKDQGLLAIGNAYRFWDVNPTIGGPLAKDRVWFYGGYRYSGTRSYVAGGFNNTNPRGNQYCNLVNGCTFNGALVPDSRDLNQQAIAGDTFNRGETLNLTVQLSPRNKATFFGHFNQRLVDCNGCSATTSPEASTYFTHRPEYLLQSTWTNPYTNKLLFEGGFTFYNERWIFGPQPNNINGYGPDAVISKSESSNGERYGAGTTFTTAGNHQYNMRAAMNYVTGSHAFKVGVQDLWGTRHYLYDTNQAQTWTLSNGVPSSITEYARPLEDLEHLKAELGIYAQDRWTIKTLTINVGLRFDWHDAYVPAQDRPSILFVTVPRHYDAIYDVPNWKDVTPRIGVAWDIFGNGRTVARANYGNYLAAESTATATANNPLNTSINQANRTWRDTNNNFVPDCDLRNPAANGECLALSQPLGALNIVTQFDPAMLRGWGVRPNDHEIEVGIAHSLTRNIAIDAQYTDHWFGNFFVTQNRANPASAYDQYCVTAPGDSRLPDGGNYQLCQNYDLNPSRFSSLNDNLITKASNFGEIKDRFRGVDLGATARLTGGGQLSGGMGFGHEVTDVCDVIGKARPGSSTSSAGSVTVVDAFLDIGLGYPTTRWCHLAAPFFQPTMKANGAYPLPWFGLTASATIQSRPGPQILATWNVPNASTTLGRAFNVGTTAPVQLIKPGTMFGDRVNQVDVRFGKNFKADRMRIRASIDIYNALNSSAILTINTTYATTNSSWLRPTSIMPGRLVKFGATVDF
jgi:Carboxypeptidase regulatory-like domain/TonB-dependent Receptor Plug Domain